MKIVIFWFKSQWSVLLPVRVRVTIRQYWIRQWLGAEQAHNQCPSQYWPYSMTHKWVNQKVTRLCHHDQQHRCHHHNNHPIRASITHKHAPQTIIWSQTERPNCGYDSRVMTRFRDWSTGWPCHARTSSTVVGPVVAVTTLYNPDGLTPKSPRKYTVPTTITLTLKNIWSIFQEVGYYGDKSSPWGSISPHLLRHCSPPPVTRLASGWAALCWGCDYSKIS